MGLENWLCSGWGCVMRWSREEPQPLEHTSLCPASGANTRDPHDWTPGFSSPCTCHSIFQPANRACVLCLGPHDWDPQSMARPTYSPRQVSITAISLFLWVPSQGHRSRPNLSSSHHSDSLRSFLQPWLYSNPSSFQFVFSENCSTCRCIFNVFLVGVMVSSTSSYSAILISPFRVLLIRNSYTADLALFPQTVVF